jgi:hypothetical protein
MISQLASFCEEQLIASCEPSLIDAIKNSFLLEEWKLPCISQVPAVGEILDESPARCLQNFHARKLRMLTRL